MNTKGNFRGKVIIKCCCFYLVNYVMYGFVLVPDCTIHFIIYQCLKYRVSEASEEKNVAPYKLPDRFALTFLVLPCF